MKKIIQKIFYACLTLLILGMPYCAFASETGVYSSRLQRTHYKFIRAEG
jgi:hypothetical protein